jgi:3-oxoacyl-[acyl-carrier-protein] synthase-3
MRKRDYMQYAKITACAKYLPERVVDNFELSRYLDTSDEWIVSRTGIKTRRVVTQENTSDLCTKVAQLLLAKANLSAQDIDFIIIATMTPDYSCPSTACLVQGNINAAQALAFDINAACSGFVYALSTADKFIRSGYRHGLVIGGEVISKIINWQDRRSAVLFGDGAGGVLVSADSKPHILVEKLQADGKRAEKLTANKIPLSPLFGTKKQLNSSMDYLNMDGRAIFDFAVRDVAKNLEFISRQAAKAEIVIDYYLLHQANIRLIEKISKKIQVPEKKFLHNIAKYGNTSAASIPILLTEAQEEGKLILNSSQKVVFAGFGGGLTWGSLLFDL